jgi:hypothetical protein
MFDAFPRFIALGVCYTLDLIESGNGVSNMSCVVNGLFALLRECEFAALKLIPLAFVDPTHIMKTHCGRFSQREFCSEVGQDGILRRTGSPPTSH